jgi:putative holo-[acyl-carrier-protein] synthase
MKVYRIEISNKKELQNLVDIAKALNFFDIMLVVVNTDLFRIKDLKNFLKDDEIKKLDVYKSEVAKINFAVSRSILNKAFETISSVPFADVLVLRDKYNKPYIKNNSGIKFNISHTDGQVNTNIIYYTIDGDHFSVVDKENCTKIVENLL